MKKLSVLLVAMAVAVSASAGVTKLVKSEMSAKQVKAKAELREANRFTRGSQTLVQGMNVQAMDWSVRPASHVLRDGASLFWDFETQAQADEWTMWDNDGDGYGWQYFNMTGVETGRMTPYSGEGLMASASYDNDLQIALYPDNWLISPVVTLNKTLSFYAAGQDAGYAAEKFSVYVCVGQPTGVNDFVQVGVERTATGSYTKYQYDLSEYAGQESCIAIRHYNVTDMFRLNIDNVTVTTGGAPEAEWIYVNGIEDLSYTITGLEKSTTYEVQVQATDGQQVSDWTPSYIFTTGDGSGVEEVKAQVNGDNNYYNLMGQKMNANNLPAGIYIHNGRKVIVK